MYVPSPDVMCGVILRFPYGVRTVATDFEFSTENNFVMFLHQKDHRSTLPVRAV